MLGNWSSYHQACTKEKKKYQKLTIKTGKQDSFTPCRLKSINNSCRITGVVSGGPKKGGRLESPHRLNKRYEFFLNKMDNAVC